MSAVAPKTRLILCKVVAAVVHDLPSVVVVRVLDEDFWFTRAR